MNSNENKTLTYDPSIIESKWYAIWESSGYFSYINNQQESYSIFLPPPNVTGTLHMGHGFQHTIMDALIRYHRMRGFKTLWQCGTDHAGIATQLVVERQLESDGITKENIGRDEFIKRIWNWKEKSGGTITSQMRRLGASCDWSRERFTMDDDLSKVVTNVFVDLYNKGLIYRDKRLVNWDVGLQSAVSDLEVVSHEEDGYIWHIRYPLQDSQEFIVVATTRPETMLGDVAVAVNPLDTRYTSLIGKCVTIPLINRNIPIIADECVDMDFGTGCVKITPAHDFNDYRFGKRHNLKPINIFTLDGCIDYDSPYKGMDRFVARKAIVQDLQNIDLLDSVKTHKLMLPRCERTGNIIEPMLTNQWFMNMDNMAKHALDAVHNGEIQFVPDNWVNVYDRWLENIEPWCISRQLWWGHRIPAYYLPDGTCVVANSLEIAREITQCDDLVADTDVLDTWFSSALWCFSTLGWPDNGPELQDFLPSSVLVTGFDIIFFWVARMIMLTQEFTNKIPFKKVYVTGLIYDANGQKMSKSKGNVIDPIDLVDGIDLDSLIKKRVSGLMNPKMTDNIIKKTKHDYPDGFKAFGADALRFTFLLLSTHGREIRFDLRKLNESSNFCNKLWNASRFVVMNVERYGYQEAHVVKLETNCWIICKFIDLLDRVQLAYDTYRFDLLATELYDFVWKDYCDWFLEFAKVDMNSETVYTMVIVFEMLLRVLHPLMPFITEELWQIIAPLCNRKNTPSIMIAKYPDISICKTLIDGPIDYRQVKSKIESLQDIIIGIRNLRSIANVKPSTQITLNIVSQQHCVTTAIIKECSWLLQNLTKLSNINFVSDFVDSSDTVSVMINNVKVYTTIEIDYELKRQNAIIELARYTKEYEKLSIMLTPEFCAKAPTAVVQKNQARFLELQNLINSIDIA